MAQRIIVDSGAIQQVAGCFDGAAIETENLLKAVQTLTSQLAAGWQGTALSRFQQTMAQNRPLIELAATDLRETARALQTAAGDYERFELQARGSVDQSAGGVSGGMVLGAATAGGVTARISTLEARKATLQAQLNNPLNKIMPDFPLQRDQDGVPWRVKADDIEDEITQIDEELAYLKGQQAPETSGAHTENIQQPNTSTNGPVAHAMRAADPANFPQSDGCVLYAQARRDDLIKISKIPGVSDYGAANYINYYADRIGQVSTDATDLTQSVAPGYAILWDRGSGILGEGEKYGHIAVVESVSADHITVSQAGFGGTTTMEISLDKLKSNRKIYYLP